MSVDGAVVLVTGGAGGIGASAARLFARDGAEVVVIADVKDASETVDAVRAAGRRPSGSTPTWPRRTRCRR